MRRALFAGLAVSMVMVGYVHTTGRDAASPPALPARVLAVPPVAAHAQPAPAKPIGAATAPSAPMKASTGLSSETGLFLKTYCISCHSDRRRTGDLTLESLDLARVAEHADTWENVVTKLRLGAMPPVGRDRPTPEEYQKALADLEGSLDRLAVTDPNPGRPVARRLTRTEYANAIRDLLSLEVDGAALLPPDVAGHGFDNIGTVLSVSPVLMERYMFAADRISRMAVGEAGQPATETYRLSHRLMQKDRMSEDLPIGSRGGLAIRHLFPADGEYELQVRLQKNDDGYIRGLREAHQLDVRLDDARVTLFTVGGKRLGPSGPIWTGNQNVEYSGDPKQVAYEFTADDILHTRFTARAGARVLGVAFLKRRIKPTGALVPEVVFDDLLHYKGGEPAVELVSITGPYNVSGVSETASRMRIFTCRPTGPADEEPCATSILSSLARRAYRRPPTKVEIGDLMDLFRQGRKDGSFENGIRMSLYGMLAGPEFLFRIEKDAADRTSPAPYRVSDLDLASRLSFFLWNSLPDDELLQAAEKGRLSQPGVLEQQVRRMLADPRASSLTTNFAAQWLALRNLTVVEPDSSQFPDFDDELKAAFIEETERLFDHVASNDRSILEMLTADYTFANERLAQHYGIPNVKGSRFRKVQLPDDMRRGLLGHGSVLTVTSYAARTSPVLRGKWVMEQLLDMPPPVPPPNVPALEERKGGRNLTMREALEEHRKNPACASCHKLMDPIGFALESFDAVGRFRTVDFKSGEPIDPSGTLFDGAEFKTTPEFRQALLVHSERFVQTATKRLFTYALGRAYEHYDAPVVRKIVREAAPGGYRWSSLVLGIVKSDAFQMRRPEPS